MIVVKFFGALFEGTGSFGIERAMGHYLARQFLPIRSPAIVAEGELTLGWQYLIFDGIPGVSIGQVRQQLSERSLVEAAGQMGVFMNSLHSVTATGLPIIPMPGGEMTWSGFVDFLKTQSENCHTNHEGWSDLPPQVLDQVQDYLLPVGELLDFASPPHLIHADLTGDHLLGRVLVGADWDSLAIIDWGDARVGNILYELVALHIDLFQADKSLLYSCLKNYRLPDFYKQDFAHKALCMVLLHQFPMPAQIYAPHGGVKTLPELADRLFGI
jgi:aminoglycoside phosphotransferase (APT) family kinase protein